MTPSTRTRRQCLRALLESLLHLEQAVLGIEWGEGLVLRYGGLYGPGTTVSRAPDAAMARAVRRRLFPIVGDGGGVWSQVHVDDAVAATLASVDHGQPGVCNIVDDEAAPVREWLRVLASALGAKAPRHAPRWLGRLVAGEAATLLMTDARGPRTRRPSASSAGSSAMRADGRATCKDSVEQ
jgi:nucleoside-diphosphate-sugar epimerase